MKSLEEIFRSNLVKLRGSRTQAQIAELAGIPVRSYQNVEANGAVPQGPNRAAIAKALGVPESHLFVDPDEFLPSEGITPQIAWEIVGKALQNLAPKAHVPSSDPAINELVAVVAGRRDLIAHLIKAAHAFLGTTPTKQSKGRPG